VPFTEIQNKPGGCFKVTVFDADPIGSDDLIGQSNKFLPL